MIKDSMEIGMALNTMRDIDPNFGWYNRAPYVLYGDPSLGITTGYAGTAVFPPAPETKSSNKTISLYTGFSGSERKVFVRYWGKDTSPLHIRIYTGRGIAAADIFAGPFADTKACAIFDAGRAKLASGAYFVRVSVDDPLWGTKVITSQKFVFGK
jgi:hypothetical protein